MNKYIQTTSIAIVILIGSLFFASPIITLYNFTHIEREEVEDDTLQVRNVIGAEAQQLYTTANDYAGWDDAYAFMQDGNQKFVSSSLGEALYSNLRLNLFCMITNDGKMLYGKAYDHHNKVYLPIPPALLQQLNPGSVLLNNKDSGVKGFVSLPEGLLMIVSRPILTTKYEGPPRGTLIIGRFLDRDETLRIGKLLNFKVEVLNFVSSAKSPLFRNIMSRLTELDNVLVQTSRSDQITGCVRLPDIYGKDAGIIRVEKPRTIYLQVRQTTWRMIQLYICMWLFIAFVFMLLRNKLTVVNRKKQQVKDQLNSFIELAVDGIFSISSIGNILMVNSRVCEMTGYTRMELLEMRFGQLFEEIEGEELLQNYNNKSVEHTLVRKDGRHMAIELTSRRMPDDTFQTFMHDISERKVMELELVDYHNRINNMAIEVSIAEESERNRIAGELHDQVGPTLLLSKLKLDQLQDRLSDKNEEEFEAVKELINQSIQDIRSLTFQLRPPILANAGLEAALKWLAQDFEQQHCIQVRVVHDEALIALEYTIRVTLYHAVRELLLNVVKHAAAKNVTITISRDLGMIVLIVEDDGVGFSLQRDYAAHSNSFGLFNTEQRIKYHGGQMHIDSSPGHGTRVFITMPLEPKA